MDLWGRGVPLSLRREERERFGGEGSRHPQANCGSQVTTGDAVFRDPVVGVIFTCVFMIQDFHHHGLMISVLQIRLHSRSRYDVDAAVGPGLAQPPITRVI